VGFPISKLVNCFLLCFAIPIDIMLCFAIPIDIMLCFAIPIDIMLFFALFTRPTFVSFMFKV
jgi:hypothetical protein